MTTGASNADIFSISAFAMRNAIERPSISVISFQSEYASSRGLRHALFSTNARARFYRFVSARARKSFVGNRIQRNARKDLRHGW